MKVFEPIIGEMVAQMPAIAINPSLSRKPQFYWGRQKDLAAFIKVKGKNHYPFIWLVVSEDEYTTDDTVKRSCQIVFATMETDQSLLNTDRADKSYKVVINPMVESFLNGIDLFDPTQRLGGFRTLKFPNYSESGDLDKGESGVTEVWDALKLYCEIEIDNSCKNIIQWQ